MPSCEAGYSMAAEPQDRRDSSVESPHSRASEGMSADRGGGHMEFQCEGACDSVNTHPDRQTDRRQNADEF